MARARKSSTGHLYTLTYTKGNTEVQGIPVGGIGAWVARLGGDDITCEELMLYRESELEGHTFQLRLEGAIRKEVSNG